MESCDGVDCQVAHRSEDEKLVADPPRRGECVICCLTLPFDDKDSTYMNCCGKTICNGCRDSLPREHCPFCNVAAPKTTKESIRRIFERIEKYNDPDAMYHMGSYYAEGSNGFTVNRLRAIELYQRASDLGHAGAHFNLGTAYYLGKGVQVDKKKGIHHYQMAAMMGEIGARCKLGAIEGMDENYDRALKHFMIAARCGHDESLEMVKKGFLMGNVTKDDFEKALREHKASQDETKSDQRDRARAARGR